MNKSFETLNPLLVNSYNAIYTYNVCVCVFHAWQYTWHENWVIWHTFISVMIFVLCPTRWNATNYESLQFPVRQLEALINLLKIYCNIVGLCYLINLIETVTTSITLWFLTPFRIINRAPTQYKDGLSRYGDLHYKDNTVARTSYL